MPRGTIRDLATLLATVASGANDGVTHFVGTPPRASHSFLEAPLLRLSLKANTRSIPH